MHLSHERSELTWRWWPVHCISHYGIHTINLVELWQSENTLWYEQAFVTAIPYITVAFVSVTSWKAISINKMFTNKCSTNKMSRRLGHYEGQQGRFFLSLSFLSNFKQLCSISLFSIVAKILQGESLKKWINIVQALFL